MLVVYASIRQRLVAALYDYIVVASYLVVIVLAAVIFRPYLIPLFTTSAPRAETAGFLFLTLPIGLYFIISESSRRRGTWGKKKARLQVRSDKDDNPPSLWRAAVRSVFKFLPWEMAHYVVWRFQFPDDYPPAFLTVVLCLVYALILIYFLCPLFNRRRKSVYDWIAGTSVVRSQ